MKSGTKYDIAYCNELSEFFNIIINQKLPLFWEDIIKDLMIADTLHDQFYGRLPKTFSNIKHFSLLEEMGLDYNHLDQGGNNFLQYCIAYESRSKSGEENIFYFTDNIIDHIASKTNHIYNLNKSNHHLLFDLLTIRAGGPQGENFISFINKYPCSNLHILDNNGENLLNHLLKSSQIDNSLFNFLLTKKLSTTHISKSEQNLLHMFYFCPSNQSNIEIFQTLVKDNYILSKDKDGDNVFTYFLKNLSTKEIPERFILHAERWIDSFISTIIEGNLKKEDNTIIEVLELLTSYQESITKNFFLHFEKNIAEKKVANYLKNISTLSYLHLNKELSNTHTFIKKQKI